MQSVCSFIHNMTTSRLMEAVPFEIGLRRIRVPIAINNGAIDAPNRACVKEVW